MIIFQRLANILSYKNGGWIFAIILCMPVFASASDVVIKNVHVFDSEQGFEKDTQSVIVQNGII